MTAFFFSFFRIKSHPQSFTTSCTFCCSPAKWWTAEIPSRVFKPWTHLQMFWCNAPPQQFVRQLSKQNIRCSCQTVIEAQRTNNWNRCSFWCLLFWLITTQYILSSTKKIKFIIYFSIFTDLIWKPAIPNICTVYFHDKTKSWGCANKCKLSFYNKSTCELQACRWW